jgi:RNA recognition motif-containing protein
MYQDSKLDPEAYAVLLEINNLPDYYDDNKLYDLFRPFGPLNLCKCVMKDGTFRGTAFVQFFNTFSSQESERQLVSFFFLSFLFF